MRALAITIAVLLSALLLVLVLMWHGVDAPLKADPAPTRTCTAYQDPDSDNCKPGARSLGHRRLSAAR